MIKLKDILIESELDILVPRRNKEEREKNHIIAIQKRIQDYIKNGSFGDLYLANLPITHLPDNLKRVSGDLSLVNSKIVKLPDNFTVTGDLNLERTQIKSLPDNLTVGGWINVMYTKLQEIPHNLRVGGSINVLYTPLGKKYTKTELEELLPYVNRIINI